MKALHGSRDRADVGCLKAQVVRTNKERPSGGVRSSLAVPSYLEDQQPHHAHPDARMFPCLPSGRWYPAPSHSQPHSHTQPFISAAPSLVKTTKPSPCNQRPQDALAEGCGPAHMSEAPGAAGQVGCFGAHRFEAEARRWARLAFVAEAPFGIELLPSPPSDECLSTFGRLGLGNRWGADEASWCRFV